MCLVASSPVNASSLVKEWSRVTQFQNATKTRQRTIIPAFADKIEGAHTLQIFKKHIKHVQEKNNNQQLKSDKIGPRWEL